MPGAWELPERALVCILHTDTTTIAWSFGLRNLIIPGGLDPVPLAGMPYDHARNTAAQAVLNNGVEWLFFLDSDVIPPRDVIPRLMAHRKPIISGIYARRSPPVSLPVMLRGGKWITDYPKNSVIEVELVGCGCLLIHRDVFLRMPHQRPGKPYFDWRVDMAGHVPPGEAMSEDFTFCTHARKCGIPVLVDTSLVCRHVGFGEATPGEFKPLEAHPST